MLQPEQSVQNWNFYKSGIDVKLETCHGHEIRIEFFRKGNGRKSGKDASSSGIFSSRRTYFGSKEEDVTCAR